MLDDLAAAIEGLDGAALRSSPGALGGAFELLDRYRARLADAVGRFDADGLWALDNAVSMTGWLKAFARQSGQTAAGWTALARRLRRVPVTAAALLDGRLSHDQVRTVLACVDDDLVDDYVAHERDLVETLTGLSVHDVAVVMRQWRERARALRPDPRPAEESRSCHLSQLPDGSWRLDGDLTAEGGAIVEHAIKAAMTPDTPDDPIRPAPQRRADALVDVCRWFLDHRASPPTCRRRPHLDITVRVEDLTGDGPGTTPSGTVLAAWDVHRWACDATVSRVLVKGRSHILDYGTATRVVSDALFLALVARDRHCRWPGCDRTADWCEGHHLVHWTKQGPTEISNLALFCSRHHHRLHHPDWQAKLDPDDATLTITTPEGRTLTSRPPPLVAGLFDDSG